MVSTNQESSRFQAKECQDVLGWLATGMSVAEIIDDFPELTETDIRACLEFAADRDHRLVALVSNT
ncbi:DUF433 domain-containing protein [Planktothrix sp. FACHB-1365]|uniref:DUF433 domain-containing protein n=1 Tax=Planktothrix sp. FACHB-1365 TaxID=2692855 RepID=UPI002814ECEF|nr:DUF433 domain-containing protein [Planktothrix sp. FACHB-1365]